MTLADALDRATTRLASAGVPEPRRNAELLLAEITGRTRSELLLRRTAPLPTEAAERYDAWIERRVGREPLQHIVGTQEFWGVGFRVDRRALIPRPETEGLIDAQAAWTRDRRALTIGVVNPYREEMEVPLKLTGARLKGTGTRWEIAGSDPMAHNDPDQPPRVVIERQPVTGRRDRLSLAPCSVTLFALDVE